MKTETLCAIAIALAATPAERELEFAPAAGTTLRKTFTERTRWTLDSMQLVFEDGSASLTPPEIEGVAESRCVVVDTYGAVSGGVPLVLRREYEKLGASSALDFEAEGVRESHALALESELEGERVVFTRESPDGDPEAKFEGSEHAASKLLAGLREDLDLRGLLPVEDVGVEDAWEIDAERLGDLFAPGGDLAFAPEKGARIDSEYLQPVQVVATALLRLSEARDARGGTAALTWKETRKDGERELALIEIELDLRARGDLGERLGALFAAVDGGDAAPKLSLEWTAEGEGTLVWDLSTGRFESLALALEVEIAVDLVEGADGDAARYRFALSGETEIAASVERD